MVPVAPQTVNGLSPFVSLAEIPPAVKLFPVRLTD